MVALNDYNICEIHIVKYLFRKTALLFFKYSLNIF